MKTQTFITKMPDKPGAFMQASKSIMEHHGNIVRVSYNKAVDTKMLFVEVRATEDDLNAITEELAALGYLQNEIGNPQIILINIRITDRPGGLYPVLQILNGYNINISYLNSIETGEAYQDFKMGLFIDDSRDIAKILQDISQIYPVNVIKYSSTETVLDNTIFYIRIGNEIRDLFHFDNEKTLLFIQESNRIMQLLQERGENPIQVFEAVLHLARFMARYRGKRFQAEIHQEQLSEKVILYTIQPPCGSNTYIMKTDDKLLFVDTGYALYAQEMLDIFHELFAEFDDMQKTILLTHSDMDHGGLLSILDDAEILATQKTANNLECQYNNIEDSREMNRYCLGYSRLNRIFTDYVAPNRNRVKILGHDVPEEHEELLLIDKLQFGDLEFEVYEGSGGHIAGETLFFCRRPAIIFTGDVYVNIKGFSNTLKEFNSLAPFLMTGVDLNPERAKQMREAVLRLIETERPCRVYGGHGPMLEVK